MQFGRLQLNRWLRIGAVLIIVGALIANWYLANALIAPAPHHVGPPPSDLPFEATSIFSESGSTLATWYLPAANSTATLVLLHPIRADRRAMISRARLFHDAGYAVVLIDFQAHAESPGGHITSGYIERHDARAAVEFAKKRNPNHRIGVVGWSLGGAATLLASPLDIDALVLESVYPSISEAVHDRVAMRLGPLSYVLTPVLLTEFRLRLGISPADLRPIDHIAGVGCPVLVASGDLDQHTTLAETQALFAAAAEPKRLVIFQGAAHSDLLAYNPEQYEREVLPFLAANLLPQKP